MHLLVTRPEPDAGRLRARLESMGHEATCAPLMEVRFRSGVAPDLSGVQALAFTSANGLRAFAALSGARALPVFAVGPATAEAARAEGFSDVRVAGGDVETLAALVAAELNAAAGTVFHAAGRHVAGDLAEALAQTGIAIRRQVLYEARAATALPAAAVRVLSGEPAPLGGVLLFSPRSAELFERLAADAGLSDRLGTLRAYCLSPAVGRALTPRRWREIAVARVPDQTSLLALLPPAGGGPA